LDWEAFVRDGPLDCTSAVNRACNIESIDDANNFYNIAVKLIVKCQQTTKEYSSRKLLLRVRPSIRDILRCVNIWHWILAQRVPSECDAQLAPRIDSFVNPYLPKDPRCIVPQGHARPDLSSVSVTSFIRSRVRQALYAAIAICYYIRLPASVKDPSNPNSTFPLRQDFLDKIKGELRVGSDKPIDFVQNWKECVEHLWSYAKKPLGIAHTDVLKENFYAVVVALHVKPTMPLLITGPAGKCLDVNELLIMTWLIDSLSCPFL
jgi:hypothetical protein